MVHVVDLDIPQEYNRIQQKALTPLAWAEDVSIGSVTDSEHAHLQLQCICLEK